MYVIGQSCFELYCHVLGLVTNVFLASKNIEQKNKLNKK